MNGKYFGEIGQSVVIGELSKFGIQAAVPLGDNLPFDLIAIVDENLYKLQVKSSSQGTPGESLVFDFSTTDFYTATQRKYSKQEVDLIFGVDLRTYEVYVFDDFENRKCLTIRLDESKNGQRKGVNLQQDFLLNAKRLKDIFGYEPPAFDGWFSQRVANTTQYNHRCIECGTEFVNGRKNQKLCGAKCRAKAQQKVERPTKEQLKKDIRLLSWRAIGRKHEVSDNTVRKWAKGYGLL